MIGQSRYAGRLRGGQTGKYIESCYFFIYKARAAGRADATTWALSAEDRAYVADIITYIHLCSDYTYIRNITWSGLQGHSPELLLMGL